MVLKWGSGAQAPRPEVVVTLQYPVTRLTSLTPLPCSSLHLLLLMSTNQGDPCLLLPNYLVSRRPPWWATSPPSLNLAPAWTSQSWVRTWAAHSATCRNLILTWTGRQERRQYRQGLNDKIPWSSYYYRVYLVGKSLRPAEFIIYRGPALISRKCSRYEFSFRAWHK